MMYLVLQNTKSVPIFYENHNINFFIDRFNPKYVLNKYRIVVIIY